MITLQWNIRNDLHVQCCISYGACGYEGKQEMIAEWFIIANYVGLTDGSSRVQPITEIFAKWLIQIASDPVFQIDEVHV